MLHTKSWPIRNDTKFIENETDLEKQLGDMECEVKEIRMELDAVRKNRSAIMQFPCHDSKHAINLIREDFAKARRAAEDDKTQRELYENKLKDLEWKLNHLLACEKSITDPDSEISKLKTQIRDLKEENDDFKVSLRESEEQLQEYRIKYLQAQQQVEELRNQQSIIDCENRQLSEQIQVEIQKMKMQFQEKLQELAPLPDLLKGAQINLQEAKQLQRLAEENSEELSIELKRVKEKLVTAVTDLNEESKEKHKLLEENTGLRRILTEKEKEIETVTKDNDDLKCKTLRLQEKLSQQETRFDEKVAEFTRLLKDLEELRDECNRSTARCKERAESSKRYMQAQISELERQLIQSRAQCRSCLKERDETRQRIQKQVNDLQEKFELVELRYRALQAQVVSMKSAYSQVLLEEDSSEELIKIQSVT